MGAHKYGVILEERDWGEGLPFSRITTVSLQQDLHTTIHDHQLNLGSDHKGSSPKQRGPDVPLLGQLIWRNPTAFPGQPRIILPTACVLGFLLDFLPAERTQNPSAGTPPGSGILTRCLILLTWFFSMCRSSDSESLPDDRTSPPISKGEPRNPLEETHLYPQTLSCFKMDQPEYRICDPDAETLELLHLGQDHVADPEKALHFFSCTRAAIEWFSTDIIQVFEWSSQSSCLQLITYTKVQFD